MYQDSAQEIFDEPAELLGDLSFLSARIGSPESLETLTGISKWLQRRTPSSLPELREFLTAYQDQLLIPLEIAAIFKAHELGVAGKIQELIEMDHEIRRQGIPDELASASRHVGRRQLRRLRPLKDNRVIQRYLDAVDSGKAHGWHTVVYGLILACFSLPLRQGLVHYAVRTQNGFLQSASHSLRLGEVQTAALLEEYAGTSASMVQAWIEARPAGGLRAI